MSSLEKQREEPLWWHSLDELADTPRFRAFLESEFPSKADPGGINRRRWLQVMGASLVFAAANGCRWEKQEILPMAKRPEGYTPGKTRRFCTTMPLGDTATGLEVTCVDGRPIKIEGNPRHPYSLGATNAMAQAALLELYDPDRSDSVTSKGVETLSTLTWEEFLESYKAQLADLQKSGGAGFRILSEPDSSPTLTSLRARLLKALPQAKWYDYEPLGDDNARKGARLALGRPLRTHLALDKARVIICLDADLLGSHPTAVRHARDYAAGRDPQAGPMNRMYVVESGVSLTGAAADHRLPLQSTRIQAFVEILEHELAAGGKSSHDESSDPVKKFAHAVAEDLLDKNHRGHSVVCIGEAQPPEAHAAVHRINALLGNVGKNNPVTYTQVPDPQRPSSVAAIRELVDEMQAGKVGTLLILGGNPVYDAPADLDFGDALEKVKTSAHLSTYRDETSRHMWHLPRAHFLESWGDGLAYDGTYSVIQPMIAPLRNGRSAIEVLSYILAGIGENGGKVTEPQKLVQQTFKEQIAGKSAAKWQQVLRDGLAAKTQWPVESVAKPAPPKEATKAALPGDEQLEVVFRQDASVYDGRFANNSWLQELPNPITKMTWGNAALISPATAEKLGVKNETISVLNVGERTVRIPVYVLPGQAAGSISLPLGYGRTSAGSVGGNSPHVEPVGVDVYPLRTTDTMHVSTGVSLEPTGEACTLACTQDHHAIDTIGRDAREQRAKTLIQQATLEHYQEHPDFAKHAVHHPPLESLWEHHEYKGHRWGMTVDLSKCIGCESCVAACQAENNIPVVGKDQVAKGREMHWLRVDRYFRGEPDNPQVAHQPIPCQQCELAPCEQVCPVAATVHTQEGLNDMVFNRCVGTRYCANNCPYKVRRFNYFNLHKDLEDPENEIAKMKYNPQVTVRSRGVMEKCTYCVQRIQAAKIAAKGTDREIPDGEIKTACQQACPSGAIVFGDLSDKNSEVLKLQKSPRAYAILAELNIRPRTMYLARIRNPNPKLESQHEGTHDGHS